MELLTTAGSGVLGGLILNVMPCVFPVLFFKLNAWIAHGDASPQDRRLDAVGYLLGTLVTFSAFAALVISLRASGQSLGWGMQMQNPGFVGFLVALLFAFGLNAVDVFSFNVSVQGGGSGSGLMTSFRDGALVTLVSTPCSAPFLGGAAAAALARDTAWWETMLLFWSIGLGLAMPVLLIGFIPALNRLLPRPGAWMEYMKVVVAFTLFFAAAWLFKTMQVQLSPESANNFLWFLIVLAGGMWLWEKVKMRDGAAARWGGQIVALGVIVAGGFGFIDFEPREKLVAAPCPDSHAGDTAAASTKIESVVDGKLVWTPYAKDVIAKAGKNNQIVFVDFTADWCASCKTFEKTNINIEPVRQAIKETGVVAMKADLTAQDSDLWDVLGDLGRSGLPTYAFYLPDGTTKVLPEGPPLKLDETMRKLVAAQK